MIEELTKNSLLVTTNILSTETVNKNFQMDPFAHYLVYKDKNKIIGFLYYSEIYERIEINQIEVEEKYRRQQIGTKLLEFLCKKEKNITLEVKKDNIPAIKLYEKFDFKEVAIRKGYYQGIDGILMEKKIAKQEK